MSATFVLCTSAIAAIAVEITLGEPTMSNVEETLVDETPETEAHVRRRHLNETEDAPTNLSDPTVVPGTVEHDASDDEPEIEAHARRRH